MLNLYVTGADESSNKIFVTAGLTAIMHSLGFSAGVYKPVEVGASLLNGFVQSPELAFIKFVEPYVKTYYSYFFKANNCPLLAAAAEKIVIEKNVILRDFQNIQDVNECLVVDGISGLASPLSKNFMEEDMVKSLDLPLLMVGSAKKSSLNNIILSINHAKEIGIDVRGVVITDYPQDCSDINTKLMPRLIEEYTGASVLGILPKFNFDINPDYLIAEMLNGVDIEGVFQIPIAKLQM